MIIDTIDELKKHGLIITEDMYIQGCSENNTLEGIIIIPNSIKDFTSGGNGFKNCTKITHIVLPDGFRSIGNSKFYGCTSLVSINIPRSINYIGSDAFGNCHELTYIKIPAETKYINQPFSGINIYIDVEKENPYYYSKDGSLYDIKNKALIKYYCNTPVYDPILPQDIENIIDNAFSGCSMLFSISIPDSIKKIGDYAFENCKNLTKNKV